MENWVRQKLCRLMFDEVLYQTRLFDSVPGTEPAFVYDCKSTLYSSRRLFYKMENITLPRNTWDRQLQDYCQYLSFTVHIAFSKPIILNLRDARFFDKPSEFIGREDHELRSFFELLTNQLAVNKNIAILRPGQVFFKNDCVESKFGISFYRGVKKQCRLVADQGRNVMKLVIDPVITPFYTKQTLADSMMDVFDKMGLSRRSVTKFHNLYLNVGLLYRVDRNKIFFLRELSAVPLKNL